MVQTKGSTSASSLELVQLGDGWPHLATLSRLRNARRYSSIAMSLTSSLRISRVSVAACTRSRSSQRRQLGIPSESRSATARRTVSAACAFEELDFVVMPIFAPRRGPVLVQ